MSTGYEPPSYRRGAKYMLNDTSLKVIKQLLDKYGGAGFDGERTGHDSRLQNSRARLSLRSQLVTTQTRLAKGSGVGRPVVKMVPVPPSLVSEMFAPVP